MYNAKTKFSVVLRYLGKQTKHGAYLHAAKLEDQESTQKDGIAYLYISKTMIWCAIAERVMKDWSCERLVLVASKRF